MNRRHLRNRPTLADMARAFGPVDAPLAQLAKGYVAADGETGAPVTRNIDGRWIDLAPGLEGLAIAWRRVLAHYRVEIDVEPLDRLADFLSAQAAGALIIRFRSAPTAQAIRSSVRSLPCSRSSRPAPARPWLTGSLQAFRPAPRPLSPRRVALRRPLR